MLVTRCTGIYNIQFIKSMSLWQESNRKKYKKTIKQQQKGILKNLLQ